MAWKRSSVRSRPGPPFSTTCGYSAFQLGVIWCHKTTNTSVFIEDHQARSRLGLPYFQLLADNPDFQFGGIWLQNAATASVAWKRSLARSRSLPTMAIEMKVVGLDIAKNVFQIHSVDRRGETIHRAARPASVAPDTWPDDWFPHATGESDSWSARRVRHCASPSSQPGAQSADKRSVSRTRPLILSVGLWVGNLRLKRELGPRLVSLALCMHVQPRIVTK